MLDSKYTKPVNAVISSHYETDSNVILTGNSVSYSICDRTSSTNRRGHYFVSVGLPFESDALPTGSTISLLYPELQQLNVDKIILGKISNSGYSEYIDGRSFEITVPLVVNAVITAYTLYSSTYSSDKALRGGESSPLLGDNIAFLFCDTINRPYTGHTVNEMGQLVSHSAVTTWNTGSNLNERPTAVSYLEVQGNLSSLNSDNRTVKNYAVSVSNGYPAHIGYGSSYNYDVPVGFVILDKGLIVFTHPTIVNNFYWTTGLTQDGQLYSGLFDDNKEGVYFTANTHNVKFVNIDTMFKTTAVCMALNGEFYISNNRTWDRTVASSQFGGYRPVYLTEIGLYNAFGELIAVGKFSEPVRRYVNDIFTFSIELNM